VAQADICRPGRKSAEGVACNYWPQLDFEVIRAIEAANPRIKFLLNTRNVPELIRSITQWASLRRRIVRCDIIGLPAGTGATDAELEAWITGHYEACRAYFHGKSNFIEFDIADANSRDRLEDFIGIELPWWGVANANKRAASPGPREA
jgi:hypothetical protein